MTSQLLQGDCLKLLRDLPDAGVDSIITDPPYELAFMGKRWDASHVAYNVAVWRECLRVLKPGGYLLAFGGTRTYHRMTCAIEDAGFEIRDSIHWVYGSGFPKSLDVSKAIDKAAGAERPQVLVATRAGNAVRRGEGQQGSTYGDAHGGFRDESLPATDAARQWSGWGTALKPAHEPVVVARKPLVGTVAANVLAHGTGALNIDGCRVAYANPADMDAARVPQPDFTTAAGRATHLDATARNGDIFAPSKGRWPPNILLSHTPACDEVCADDCPVAHVDQQSGKAGGASRFFPAFRYQAKASRADRGAGNAHPTVKPSALMQWLVRLATPPGGVVLDPFMGSGTTGVAAVLEGFRFVGIELIEEYADIARVRIAHAATSTKASQSRLFDEVTT